MLKKIGLIGIMVAGLVTSSQALEDGNYKCIITALSYKNLTKKLPKKDWQVIDFTKKGQVITDKSGEKFSYYISSNDVDIYKNKNFMIAVPGWDVNNNMFNMNFESTQKDSVIYNGHCIKK